MICKREDEDQIKKFVTDVRMKKGETKCKSCDIKTDEPCELANYTTEIDGKTYTFCCKPRATQYKKEKVKEK